MVLDIQSRAWRGRLVAWALSLAFVAGCVCVGGCSSAPAGPGLGTLYNRAARHADQHRNPVIVIPGIMGSKLIDRSTGTIVWGAYTGKFADPETPAGARLVALPMAEGKTLAASHDGIEPQGALESITVDVLGLPVSLDAYAAILATLGVGGYRDESLGLGGSVDYGDEHFTCFQFDYDWRRDNVENAARLGRFIDAKKAYVAAEMDKRFGVKNADVRFDIVAHSMGGLVARYYLRYGQVDLPADGSAPKITWAGAKHVERLIVVGTPSAGSAKALVNLVEGADLAPGFVPMTPPAVLGTMPSLYQLLPRGRHGALVDAADDKPIRDMYDPALWEAMKWGLASPGQADVLATLLPDVSDPATRRRIALDHQRKCLVRAQRFAEAMDRPSAPPAGTQLMLFAGDAVATPVVISANRTTGRIKTVKWAPGDGTVARSSALLDERLAGQWTPALRTPIGWRNVTFLFTGHLGMTKDPAFADNVLYQLLEAPR